MAQLFMKVYSSQQQGLLLLGQDFLVCGWSSRSAIFQAHSDLCQCSNFCMCLFGAGRRFHAASAFSVHVKRLLTPNKRGDDGWKSVHVDGRSLEEWRTVYFEKNSLQRKSNRGTEGPSNGNQTRRASRKDKSLKCRASTPHGSETLPQVSHFPISNIEAFYYFFNCFSVLSRSCQQTIAGTWRA